MRNETMAKRVRENLAKLNQQKAEIQTQIDQQEKLLAILEPPQGEEVSLDLGAPPAAVARKGAK
jgi:hypothetical protein